MSTKPTTDDDSTVDDHFSGEYNAFGNMGRTTSNPSILVWLDGREDVKFGLHHGTEYGEREVFGWLLNNVRSVPFGEVEQRAVQRDETLVIHLSPSHEPVERPAEQVFEVSKQ